jgi:GAF domain-containing protein
MRRLPVKEAVMPRGKTTSGTCTFCGASVRRPSVARHLGTCPDYQAALQRAERSRRRTEPLFHLRAKDAYGGQFWLELEMRGSVALQDLDDYLRAIWYDFGTESETRIEVVGEREGKPIDSHPIALLARNVMPAAECIDCGAPAAFLCIECVTEQERWGVLCAAHAATHPHADYGEPLRLVNSPRLGLCGYDGPAEAPY